MQLCVYTVYGLPSSVCWAQIYKQFVAYTKHIFTKYTCPQWGCTVIVNECMERSCEDFQTFLCVTARRLSSIRKRRSLNIMIYFWHPFLLLNWIAFRVILHFRIFLPTRSVLFGPAVNERSSHQLLSHIACSKNPDKKWLEYIYLVAVSGHLRRIQSRVAPII